MNRSNDNHSRPEPDSERPAARTTAGAESDDVQLTAFLQAFENGIDQPCDAFVIGEPVSVLAFDYDGNPRRGIVARCRREDGSEHVIPASELRLAPRSRGGPILAAYHEWFGLAPLPEAKTPPARPRQHKAEPTDIDLNRPVELIVLSVKERAARCRLPGTDRVITLRASGLCDIVPGEIAVVEPNKQWSYGGHPYLSGEVESVRLDVAALGLTPLSLTHEGEWDPKDEYWGEPIGEWAKPIIARGPRPAYEMEQVVPGRDLRNFDSDPIGNSTALRDAGDYESALRILMELCQADLRCLDAHAHLGNFVFEHNPADAIRHYEVGIRIGELSLPPDFDGLLPWGLIDNRPFMRCMHSYGLCLWRLGRVEEAERIFDRMLWLNPSDNQDARSLIDDVRTGLTWEACERGERRRSRRGR